ncbi:RNA-directed DNA polymerase, eukaryota, reverse transcriptase zinc-binding domain protein [Tanacetum coccineum]|uniref:RNA-directed DNA polymerase, eukaryota, reverse transcriptase zinc-binding domain protein n=1 Tax=Tanacetum coccineum TaxID=301880 RepID=A0ABQ5C3Q6_9ASTR
MFDRLNYSHAMTSNADDTAKISLSVYVSNFPSHLTIHELWNICGKIGTLVDVFIANHKNKLGQTYAVSRYIKVENIEALIGSFCNVWIGKLHLHANIARFARKDVRAAKPNVYVKDVQNGDKNMGKRNIYLLNMFEDMGMMQKTSHMCLQLRKCISQRDYSLSLVGKVKEFSSLSNLEIVLASEGFDNVTIKYMGGFWVLIEFHSILAKDNFKSHVGVGTWFSTLQQASCSFKLDGRVAWVDIKGVPLKVWTNNTFTKIISKWGELVYEEENDDSCLHRKRVCINTTLEENIFESFKIIAQGKVYWVRAKEVNGWNLNFIEEKDNDDASTNDNSTGDNDSLEKNTWLEDDSDVDEEPETLFEQEHVEYSKTKDKNEELKGVQSEDPFNIYELLEKNQNCKDGVHSEETLKYPPGFTHRMATEINSNDSDKYNEDENKDVQKVNEEEVDSVARNARSGSMLKEDVETSTLKVGQTMGYKMDGCIKNIEEIVVSRGENEVNFMSLQETKMESIDVFYINLCWGNSMFDYVCGPSIGKSGVWIPNGKSLLIILIYAPQESSKKMLWDYLYYMIENWNGEVIVIGDFNKVRSPEERFGSIFNKHGAEVFNSFIALEEGLMESCLNISAITLDRYLSDHRPILLREVYVDYGPVPFRFFHYWFELEGFHKFVENAWNDPNASDPNAISRFMKKLKLLKLKIRNWIKVKKESSNNQKAHLKDMLVDIDVVLDKGDINPLILNKRATIIKDLQNLDRVEALEVAQKSKIK